MARHIDKHPKEQDGRAAQDTTAIKYEYWAADSGVTKHMAPGATELEKCLKNVGYSVHGKTQRGRRY